MRTSSVIQLMNFDILFKNVLNYNKGKIFLDPKPLEVTQAPPWSMVNIKHMCGQHRGGRWLHFMTYPPPP